jgi:hypothetical protein
MPRKAGATRRHHDEKSAPQAVIPMKIGIGGTIAANQPPTFVGVTSYDEPPRLTN